MLLVNKGAEINKLFTECNVRCVRRPFLRLSLFALLVPSSPFLKHNNAASTWPATRACSR